MKSKSLIKTLLRIAGIVCLYFTILWSDIPVFDVPIIRDIFVHTGDVDGALLNIVTGYLSGYMVYLLTVAFPEYIRKKPIQDLVNQELAIYINKSCYLLLLMCKNYSTREEFSEILKETDIACFNNRFYENMKKFDLREEADTALRSKHTGTRLKWYEYLDVRYKDLDDKINELYRVYQSYLDEETIDLLEKIRHSAYIDSFTGNGRTFSQKMKSADDGYTYVDDVSLGIIYASNSQLNPVFSQKGGNVNVILTDYTQLLKEATVFIQKRKKDFRKDYAVNYLKQSKLGHYKK